MLGDVEPNVIRKFRVIGGKAVLVAVVRKPKTSLPTAPICGISFETLKNLAEHSNYIIGKNQFDEFSAESA